MRLFNASSHGNNFNFTRLLLASSVIISHTYETATGNSDKDFFSPILGAKISSLAVDGFFFLSGFLVYASLLRRENVKNFMIARLARIWPGLIASVFVTVLIGACFTVLPIHSYLHDETKKFILNNISFIGGSYELSGVYCGKALCNVNGSLWSVPWEIRCYIFLSILFVLGFAGKDKIIKVVFPGTLAFVLAWHLVPHPDVTKGAIWFMLGRIDRVWFMFALGIVAFIFFEKIRLSWWILLILFALTALQNHFGIQGHIESLLAGYTVLCLGFLTIGEKPFSAQWQDYSYGMYIYAFPMMTLLQQIFHFKNPWAFAFVNFSCTLPIAAMSWHFIEKPSVKWMGEWMAKAAKN